MPLRPLRNPLSTLNPTHPVAERFDIKGLCGTKFFSLFSQHKLIKVLLWQVVLNEKMTLSTFFQQVHIQICIYVFKNHEGVHKPPLSTLRLQVIHHVRLHMWKDLQNCKRLDTTLHMLCCALGSRRSQPSDLPPALLLTEPHMAEITWFWQQSLGVDSPCL